MGQGYQWQYPDGCSIHHGYAYEDHYFHPVLYIPCCIWVQSHPHHITWCTTSRWSSMTWSRVMTSGWLIVIRSFSVLTTTWVMTRNYVIMPCITRVLLWLFPLTYGVCDNYDLVRSSVCVSIHIIISWWTGHDHHMVISRWQVYRVHDEVCNTMGWNANMVRMALPYKGISHVYSHHTCRYSHSEYDYAWVGELTHPGWYLWPWIHDMSHDIMMSGSGPLDVCSDGMW